MANSEIAEKIVLNKCLWHFNSKIDIAKTFVLEIVFFKTCDKYDNLHKSHLKLGTSRNITPLCQHISCYCTDIFCV